MILTYALMGLLVGILSGLLGIGGGIILVPFLSHHFLQQHYSLTLSMQMAVTYSLAVVIFTSGMTASLYYRQAKISWRVVLNFIPGLLVGGLLGYFLKFHLQGSLYAQMFALFLIYVAFQLWRSHQHAQPKARTLASLDWKFFSISFATGAFSAIFGIGGGIIMTPYFLHLGLDVFKAIGSSSLCCIPVALVNSIIVSIHPQWGQNLMDWQAVLYLSMFSMLGSPLGVWFAKHLDAKNLKKIFAILLLFVSVDLLWRSMT